MAETENHTLHLLREIRGEQVETRREQRTLMELVVGIGQNTARHMARLERSIFDLRAELELSIKMEVGGSLVGAESRLEGTHAADMEAELLTLR